jgi:hypothetical protein
VLACRSTSSNRGSESIRFITRRRDRCSAIQAASKNAGDASEAGSVRRGSRRRSASHSIPARARRRRSRASTEKRASSGGT